MLAALLRSGTGGVQAVRALRESMIKHLVARVLRSLGAEQPEFRATPVATRVIGMG